MVGIFCCNAFEAMAADGILHGKKEEISDGYPFFSCFKMSACGVETAGTVDVPGVVVPSGVVAPPGTLGSSETGGASVCGLVGDVRCFCFLQQDAPDRFTLCVN